MNCDQVRDQLEAYVLGALEADEQTDVEQHLSGCPDCRRLAQELMETTSLMPRALAAVSPSSSPPTSLKDHLLQQLEASPKSQAPLVKEGSPVALPKSKPSTNGAPRKKLTPSGNIPLTRPWPWRRSRLVGVAAVLILLLLAVALGARLRVVLAEERALRAELASLFDQQEVVLEVIDSEHTIKRVLLAPEPRPSSPFPAYGKLFHPL